jgi:hypothetical protein
MALIRQKEELALIVVKLFRRVRKIAKSDTSFVMSVCPSVYLSVRMEQLGSHWKDFDEHL